jgi:hypothetical protein
MTVTDEKRRIWGPMGDSPERVNTEIRDFMSALIEDVFEQASLPGSGLIASFADVRDLDGAAGVLARLITERVASIPACGPGDDPHALCLRCAAEMLAETIQQGDGDVQAILAKQAADAPQQQAECVQQVAGQCADPGGCVFGGRVLHARVWVTEGGAR